MSQKRNRSTQDHPLEFILLACGGYLKNMDASQAYQIHCITCALCNKISFETIADLRYDIMLECGDRFLRTLTRDQYQIHQRNCNICAMLCFSKIRSALQNVIADENHMNRLISHSALRIRKLIPRIREIQKDLLTHIENDGGYLNVHRDVVNDYQEIIAANKSLDQEIADHTVFLQEKVFIQEEILALGAMGIYSLYYNLVKIQVRSHHLATCHLVLQQTDCLLETFHIKQKGDMVSGSWSAKEDRFVIAIFNIKADLWYCFWRCFLLFQENVYHTTLKIYLEVLLPLGITSIISNFLYFSCFEMLNALYLFLGPAALFDQTHLVANIDKFVQVSYQQLKFQTQN